MAVARPLADAECLSQIAAGVLLELDGHGRPAPALRAAERLVRMLRKSGQWITRKSRELIQDHWDVGLFDVAFGSLKAFGIYPALYFAGLTWTIPIMETAPLNTQLWTAVYLFLRRQILSQIGKRRYGHSLNRMDELRDRELRIWPRDARSIHRFRVDGVERTVRIRRSRLVAWIGTVRGRGDQPNVLLQAELRKMTPDREFLFRANPLRNNAYLYEEILIQKILSAPDSRTELLSRLTPEGPLRSQSARALFAEVGESLIPSYARVIEQGDSLTAALRRKLHSGFSMTSLSLRWINWSYQRTIYRKMAELEALHYRIFADILDGRSVAESRYLPLARERREEIAIWLDRANRFGARAKRIYSKTHAHSLIDSGIREARSLGLAVRLARAARRLSPSRRRRAAAALSRRRPHGP